MTFVQAGTTKERLVLATAATSDANGLISIRLGPGPLGYVWQGSVTVTNAPSGALFTASVASTAWGQWAGPTNFGPVQLWGNETLVVAGVGLQPSTQYSMLFFGVSMPEHLADPLPPVAPMSVVGVETTTLLLNGVLAPANGGLTRITPPTLTRRLTVVISDYTSLDSNVSVKGVTTGVNYGIVSLNPSFKQVMYFSIEPNIDAQYDIQVNTSSGPVHNVHLWVAASVTNPLSLVEQQGLDVLSAFVQNLPGTLINTGGSPVGPFNLRAAVGLGIGNNQQVIAAPAAGSAIYLQSLQCIAFGAAAANAAGTFHATGIGAFGALVVTQPPAGGGAFGSPQLLYPGGFELPANTALLVDIIGAGVTIDATYAVGQAL